MSAPDDTDALRWLQFAMDDLGAAKAIASEGHLPNRLVCFHCQQAVEKALKALLIGHAIDFPRTHDLNLLRQLQPTDAQTKLASANLSALTVYAAEARYPGDFPSISAADAREALNLAEHVVQVIGGMFSDQ